MFQGPRELKSSWRRAFWPVLVLVWEADGAGIVGGYRARDKGGGHVRFFWPVGTHLLGLAGVNGLEWLGCLRIRTCSLGRVGLRGRPRGCLGRDIHLNYRSVFGSGEGRVSAAREGVFLTTRSLSTMLQPTKFVEIYRKIYTDHASE